MKATGIVRRIDELGRIVIPKEIRRTLRIQESDPMEIYMGDDGSIQLKKYSSVGGLKEVADQYVQALNGAFGLTAAVTDKEACVAAAGRQRRWLLDKPLLDAEALFDELIEYRELIRPYVGDAVTFVHQALKAGRKKNVHRRAAAAARAQSRRNEPAKNRIMS